MRRIFMPHHTTPKSNMTVYSTGAGRDRKQRGRAVRRLALAALPALVLATLAAGNPAAAGTARPAVPQAGQQAARWPAGQARTGKTPGESSVPVFLKEEGNSGDCLDGRLSTTGGVQLQTCGHDGTHEWWYLQWPEIRNVFNKSYCLDGRLPVTGGVQLQICGHDGLHEDWFTAPVG
jgi:hypothetical protein